MDRIAAALSIENDTISAQLLREAIDHHATDDGPEGGGGEDLQVD